MHENSVRLAPVCLKSYCYSSRRYTLHLHAIMLPYLFLALFSVIKPASQAYSWPLSSFYEKEKQVIAGK